MPTTKIEKGYYGTLSAEKLYEIAYACYIDTIQPLRKAFIKEVEKYIAKDTDALEAQKVALDPFWNEKAKLTTIVRVGVDTLKKDYEGKLAKVVSPSTHVDVKIKTELAVPLDKDSYLWKVYDNKLMKKAVRFIEKYRAFDDLFNVRGSISYDGYSEMYGYYSAKSDRYNLKKSKFGDYLGRSYKKFVEAVPSLKKYCPVVSRTRTIYTAQERRERTAEARAAREAARDAAAENIKKKSLTLEDSQLKTDVPDCYKGKVTEQVLREISRHVTDDKEDRFERAFKHKVYQYLIENDKKFKELVLRVNDPVTQKYGRTTTGIYLYKTTYGSNYIELPSSYVTDSDVNIYKVNCSKLAVEYEDFQKGMISLRNSIRGWGSKFINTSLNKFFERFPELAKYYIYVAPEPKLDQNKAPVLASGVNQLDQEVKNLIDKRRVA